MNVLAFGVHPDDLELGCGGTLVTLAHQGARVTLCVMNPVPLWAEGVQERRQDQERAAEMLGAELVWGPSPEHEFTASYASVGYIDRLIGECQADLILTPYWRDSHQEHVALAQVAMGATRRHPHVLMYEGPTSLDFQPVVFADIRSTFQDKLRLLSALASQHRRWMLADCTLAEWAERMAKFRGIQSRIGLAEAFVPLRYILTWEHP